ncbi:hypothetical protein PR202_gb02644 [Eleusine coracana subsp. coracana]|uniref:DUF630 domain-containing protein n=1 Tax=Eleusine coracana subsp. coracana TaxID=191504 RepID=A0AAV5DZ40_ELECO|nr:hypothetical protein PR202_gb02644 [Eleusine coracana subsp. coracana]
MGCAASRLEDEEAVKMCRDRREFIKQALEQRKRRFASSHIAYIESLKRVSMALQRFVAGDDHLELIFDPFISPVKQQKPEMLGLPYSSYEKRTVHVAKYLRSGQNPSVSVEERPRLVETVRVESHYPMDNYSGMDRLRSSSYYPPYDKPNYPPPSAQEPVRNSSHYMPYDRSSYASPSPQEPVRTSYYAPYDRPNYPSPSPQEQQQEHRITRLMTGQVIHLYHPRNQQELRLMTGQVIHLYHPRNQQGLRIMHLYDRPSYPPPSAQDQEPSQWDFFLESILVAGQPMDILALGVAMTMLSLMMNWHGYNGKVELDIKAHKKELMRNKVANAEETPGFTVYLNRRPASLVEAMKDIDNTPSRTEIDEELFMSATLNNRIVLVLRRLSRMWHAMAERPQSSEAHHRGHEASLPPAPPHRPPRPSPLVHRRQRRLLRTAVALECEIRAWRGALESWLSAQRSYARALAAWARRCLGVGAGSHAVAHAAALPAAFVVCMEWAQAVDAASEARVMDGLDFFVAGVGSVCSARGRRHGGNGGARALRRHGRGDRRHGRVRCGVCRRLRRGGHGRDHRCRRRRGEGGRGREGGELGSTPTIDNHQHTMKVIRLQGASDVAKAKLRGMRAHMRGKLLDCQISVMQNCMAAFGIPVFAWVIVHDIVSYSQKPSVCASED